MGKVSYDRALRRRIASAPGPCHLCGSSKLELEDDRWEADHLVPQVEGGKDTEANLRKAHRFCNRLRRARPLTEELYDEVRRRRQTELFVQG